MGAKPILRVGKIKSCGRSTPESVGGHLARRTPTPNAAPDRTALNRWLRGTADMDMRASIKAVMHAAGVDPANVRKDAVLANDLLLTISPEWFRPDDPEAHGTWSEDRVRVLEAEAMTLLRKTFGKRLVAAVVHLDEATPHIQAVVVPLMKGKDGNGWRLSGRDMFGPEQLAALQQDWEDRMQPHGVGPRTKGSRARHTTLREYYGALEATRSEDPRIPLEISAPPARPVLGSTQAHAQAVGEWRLAEAKRIKDEMRPLAVQAARGRLYDAERRSGIEQRAILSGQGHALEQARADLAATEEALVMTKEEAARLRRTPINEVAAALGWTEPVLPRENAIDLVKRAGGLDYQQALAWLAQRFSPDVAATAVREVALPMAHAAALGEPVHTKAELVKAKAINQQLGALAAPAYRVTVMQEMNGRKVGRNIGRTRDSEAETLFTQAEVVDLVPRLTAENMRDWNVFVTPIDAAVHHVLVDDLDANALHVLRGRGYQPATVLESSPGNFQAVLKVPVSAAPKEAVNTWFKDLNRDLGDQSIVGLSHPFRLAGFENRKEKHRGADTSAEGRFPFVRMVEAVNVACRHAMALVRQYARQAEAALVSSKL